MDQPTNPESQKTNESPDILSEYYQGYQQLELESAQTQVRKARNALFVVAGLSLVANLIVLGAEDQLSGLPLVFVLFVSAIFAGLGFLTKKQPLAAIIIGLVLFVGLWIIDIVVLGPEHIFQGILLRGVIIYFLVKGLKYARDAERLKKEINLNKKDSQ